MINNTYNRYKHSYNHSYIFERAGNPLYTTPTLTHNPSELGELSLFLVKFWAKVVVFWKMGQKRAKMTFFRVL